MASNDGPTLLGQDVLNSRGSGEMRGNSVVHSPGVADIKRELEKKLTFPGRDEKGKDRLADQQEPGLSSSSAASPRPPSDVPPPPPPPSDLPPLPPSPFFAPASALSTTPPRFGPSKPDPNEIDRIADNFVQAYVDDGLDIKAIGRGNMAPHGGEKAFKAMSQFFNSQLGSSGLPAVVQASKAAIEAEYGDRPQDLQPKKSADSTEGQKVEVDLALVEPYARPILTFVAGAKQLPSESGLTPGVLVMINAIDAKMRDALLAHCKDQLKAAALARNEPDADARLEKIAKYGWNRKKFDRLIKQGVYSAKAIEKTRVDLILNLVFTRCVTPYIMFAGRQVNQDGSPAQTDIAATTRLLSVGVNRLFNRNYTPFCKALIQETDTALPPASDKELDALRIADRRDSIVKKTSPSSRSLAYPGKRARHSMPDMLQGSDHQQEMARQAKAQDEEMDGLSATVDYEMRRDVEIDRFKLGHGEDFGNLDFAMAFGKLLRAWKRENGAAPLDKISVAMQALYTQAKQAMPQEVRRTAERQPVASSKRHGREVSITPVKRRESTSSDDEGTDGLDKLTARQRTTLTDFLKSADYKSGFERYPQLRNTIEDEVASWAKEGVDSNFASDLKKLFETELRRCVRLSQKAFGRDSNISNDELKKAVGAWREKPENAGKIMLLDDLRKIMPGSIHALHVPGLKESSLTRSAESSAEQFLRRAEVKDEMKNNKSLKEAFLNNVADWLNAGAFGEDHASRVQQFYEDALQGQFREKLKADGIDGNLSGPLKKAVQTWQRRNKGVLLSTAVLNRLFEDISNGRQ